MPDVPDLNRELEGVEPDSPPAPDVPEPTNEPEPDAPANDADGDGDGEKDGRDINNLQREFDRKYQRLESKLDQVVDRILSQPTPEKEPSKQSGNQLDDMSIDQLKALRAEVPEERQKDFDDYMTQRIIDDAVDKRVSAFAERQTRDTARTMANQQAVDRFPELKDKASDFHAKVQTKLNELGPDYVRNNPRAILDAANDVALAVGARYRTNPRLPAAEPANAGNQQTPNVADDGTLSDEKAAEIAASLKRAMPNKEFDLESIKERHKEYNKRKSLYIRG
jgi:hypothetical protein